MSTPKLPEIDPLSPLAHPFCGPAPAELRVVLVGELTDELVESTLATLRMRTGWAVGESEHKHYANRTMIDLQRVVFVQAFHEPRNPQRPYAVQWCIEIVIAGAPGPLQITFPLTHVP